MLADDTLDVEMTEFERIEAEEEEAKRKRRIAEAATGIIQRLQGKARDYVAARKLVEERWLEDIRAYQGKYDPEIEEMLKAAARSGSPRSRAFVKICKSKTDAWEARLSDLLFPADDRNWGINPTPVPSLTESAERAVKAMQEAEQIAEQKTQEANNLSANGADATAALNEATAAGAQAVAARTAAQEAQGRMQEAKKRCEAMVKEIDDQLTECLYPKRSRDVIRDGTRLGVGIMKGPMVANRAARTWGEKEGGGFELSYKPDERPEYLRVDPWHFFPDPNATSVEDMEDSLERHLPTQRDLRRMVKTLGFDEAAVRELLEEGPGNALDVDLNYLNQLRAITGEGDAIKGRYIMWEYNGPLERDEICALLEACGRTDDAKDFAEHGDILDEHMVTLYFCNGRLLKLAEHYVLDSGECLYSVFSFSPGEASIMGARGVPNLMLDSLRALNAAWRMMLDNAALATAPQIVVDKKQLTPEDGRWRLSAGKVWVRTGEDMGSQHRAFDVFNLPINQAQIAGIIELALKFIDEETSLPLIAQGEQGSHVTQTMGGMTMLFNSANVVFRRVVKNWDDDVTSPNIRRLYDWNMQFSPKEEIKGDMQVEARGTSVLLVREVQSQNLMVIATQWTGHPILGAAVKAYGALRMAIQSLGISPDDILETEEDFKKNLAAQAGSAEQSPDIIRAQATIQAAQITAESRAADGKVQLQIAEIRRETELVQLAHQTQMSLEDLKAKLDIKKVEMASKERIFAAEMAVQESARREAAAKGQPAPGGGGGYI